MSSLWAETYDYAIAVTKSDTVDDPSGPFAGLLVTVAGNVALQCNGGPSATVLTIPVVVGQYLRFPVRRVNNTSTTATVLGLVSAIVRQGA